MADYSKSEYFHFRPNGEIFMMKHVETKKDNPRLLIGAAIDQYSRVAFVKYYMDSGENNQFVRTVFLEAFEEKPDWKEGGEITGHKRLLQGIPRELYFDRSNANTSSETEAGLLKLNIKKITGSVEFDSRGRKTNRSNSKARGMIEKFIRDFKQCFEARLWGKKLLGDLKPGFSLTELNEWAEEFCQEFNSRPHPVLDEARWNLFKPVLSEAVFPPPEAKTYFLGWTERTVVKRLILGKKKQYFIAPDWCNDGEKVEILLSGRDCYIFHNRTMIKLKPQKGSIRHEMESETGCEIYEGMNLRQRLGQEILNLSGGEFKIPTLSD
jgi:hypothetical protein